MYIYKVSQDLIKGYDCDYFKSFVIICNNEETARYTHPNGTFLKGKNLNENSFLLNGWVAPELVKVELIGKALKNYKELTIICCEFIKEEGAIYV